MLTLRSVLPLALLATVSACGLNAAGELAGLGDAQTGDDVGVPRMDASRPDSHTQAPDGHTVGTHDAKSNDAPSKDSGHDVTLVDAPADSPSGSDVHAVDSGHDAGEDSGHDAGHDAGVDAAPPPCPAIPDCSNPNCTAEGYVCVPPPPTSWTLANVDITSNSTCPTGYTLLTGPEVTAPNADPAMCACTCNLGGTTTCESGNIVVGIGTMACTNATATWAANNGNCMNEAASFEPFVQVTSTPQPSGATCTPGVTQSLPMTESVPAYVCAANGPPSTTGCSSGNVCTAKTTDRPQQCILQSGAQTCTASYPTPVLIGTSVIDTRGCIEACGCNGPTGGSCGDPTWTFYSGMNCNGTSKAVDMDGNCDATAAAANNNYQSYRYSATVQGMPTCGMASGGATPTGSATLVGESTLCCTQ